MMNMLFLPGQIFQAISTLIFYLIILVLLGGGAYIWFQDKHIENLQSSLALCKQTLEIKEKKKTFVEENLRILKKNCERKPKPVIIEGKLKLENLFNGPSE